MAGSDRFSATIERIYAAAADETLWADALSAAANLTGSLAASMEIFDKSPFALTELHVVGLPPRAETDYLEHYAHRNPRADYAFRHLSERTLTDYQILDERQMDGTAYYAKYLAPIDLRYFVSSQMFNTAAQQAVVTIQRTRRQGHAGREEIASMRRLTPHFRRAHDMAVRLRTARHVRGPIEAAIDWLADGIVLLRADGAIVHANAAMLAIAASDDGISLTRRGIGFTGAGERGRFQAALRVAEAVRLRTETGEFGQTDFPVARASGAPAYIVCVRPLVQSADTGDGATAFVVFVHDPLATHVAGAEVLRSAFGLTEAEADLARALQAGTSPAGYARARGLSVNTVYTHLRRLKEKTGTARIADLINRLDGVRLPIRAD